MRAPIITSPSAPAAAQKTYKKVLGEKKPAAPVQATRALDDEVNNPKPSVYQQFTQVAPTPSDPVLGYMQEQGWTVPVPDQPAVLDEVYKENTLTPLQPYEYTLDTDQQQILKDVFEGAPGVEIPRAAVSASDYIARPSQPTPPLSGYGASATQNSTPVEKPAAAVLKSEDVSAMELTWDQYDALSADQKQAIDFNTLFLDAREEDLFKSRPTPDEQLRTQYDQDIEDMFGKGGGTETYAPNTVALLKQINFKAVGQDIDDFLSLDKLTDMEELKDFSLNGAELKRLSGDPTMDERIAAASGTQPQAVERLAVRASGRTLDQVMSDVQFSLPNIVDSMALARGDNVKLRDSYSQYDWGTGEVPEGYVLGTNPKTDKEISFAGAWRTLLTQGEQGLATIQERMAQGGADPLEMQELYDYLGRRAAHEDEWGRAQNMGFTPALTPVELRTLLGLGKPKERTNG